MSHLLSSCASLRFALCLLCCVPLTTGALGLGDIQVRSAMGQKLDAEIEFSALTAVEAESLTIKLAAPENFLQAGIDYMPVLRSIRFSVVKKGDRQVIHLSSDMAISDPFLTLLIELNAAGNRTLREYALLFDPPSTTESPVVVNAPETLARTTRSGEVKAGAAETRALPPAEVRGTARPSAKSNANVKSEEATSQPNESSTHIVKRGETLARVAVTRRVEGVSADQMLVALQRANPQAFVDNNINRLKAGSVLRIPESDVVRAVDPDKARESLRAQHADFQRYREQLARRSIQDRPSALTADADNASAQPGVRSSSGVVTSPAQQMPSSSVAQDKLKLTAPKPDKLPESAQSAAASSDTRNAEAKENKAGAGKQRADTLEQIASDKALADANERIAALEKNIRDMQQLATVQSSSLAEKQAAATATARPELPLPATGSEVAPTSPVSPQVASDVPAKEASAPASAQVPTEVPPDVSTPAPTPAPTPATVPASNPQQSGSVVQELLQDPPLLLAGAAGSLLLLSWIGLRYRRRSQTSVEKTMESEGVQSVFEQAGGRNIDTSNSVFHSNFVPSVSQLDTNEVDAVAEADVYIAYGRDEQAEEILQDALRLHPDRHVLRVKLLEIYATRKDRQKFGTLAAELRVLTHGVGEAWAQAAQMGQLLDPGNLLYGAALREQPARHHEGAAPSPGLASTTAAQAAQESSPVADFEFRLEGLLGEQRNDAAAVLKPDSRPASSAGLIRTDSHQSNTSIDSPHVLEFSLSGLQTSPFPPAPATTADLKSTSAADTRTDLAALQTKLDLAIACDEIGDKEGARELLAEVAGGADPALAQRAQSLLSQLA